MSVPQVDVFPWTIEETIFAHKRVWSEVQNLVARVQRSMFTIARLDTLANEGAVHDPEGWLDARRDAVRARDEHRQLAAAAFDRLLHVQHDPTGNVTNTVRVEIKVEPSDDPQRFAERVAGFVDSAIARGHQKKHPMASS